MSTRNHDLWRILSRSDGQDAGPQAAVEPGSIKILPNDPLVAYLQSVRGVVEVDRLELESPALSSLKEAGVKLAVPLVAQGELIGMLNLGPRLSEQEYSVDDRALGDLDLSGWYVEAGWDLLARDSTSALYPFLRYEEIDTDVSGGGIDDEALTFGLHYRPIPEVVLKLDHTVFADDGNPDFTTFLIGYAF